MASRTRVPLTASQHAPNLPPFTDRAVYAVTVTLPLTGAAQGVMNQVEQQSCAVQKIASAPSGAVRYTGATACELTSLPCLYSKRSGCSSSSCSSSPYDKGKCPQFNPIRNCNGYEAVGSPDGLEARLGQFLPCWVSKQEAAWVTLTNPRSLPLRPMYAGWLASVIIGSVALCCCTSAVVGACCSGAKKRRQQRAEAAREGGAAPPPGGYQPLGHSVSTPLLVPSALPPSPEPQSGFPDAPEGGAGSMPPPPAYAMPGAVPVGMGGGLAPPPTQYSPYGSTPAYPTPAYPVAPYPGQPPAGTGGLPPPYPGQAPQGQAVPPPAYGYSAPAQPAQAPAPSPAPSGYGYTPTTGL